MLPMAGRHNLMNALAAAAVATCFDISPDEIASALKSVQPPQMRGEVLNFAAGFTVVDDSYNSNPRSLLSMVRTIGETEAVAARSSAVKTRLKTVRSQESSSREAKPGFRLQTLDSRLF